MIPVGKKPTTGGPMPRMKHPAGDEDDSYLKPGQPDVDDTPGKKYPKTGGPMPKFQMPGSGKGWIRSMKNPPATSADDRMKIEDAVRKSAITKRLGK